LNQTGKHKNLGNILLIDDDEKLRHLLKRIISIEGYIIFEADSLKAGMYILERESMDVIICDEKFRDGNGVGFIEKVKSRFPQVEIIILTAYSNITSGVQSIKNGAFDYLSKGDDNDRIIPLLKIAVEKSRLQNRLALVDQRREAKYTFESILGHSGLIRSAIDMARKVALTDATVLLLGETGTGKEIFAHAIHNASNRKEGPFMALNVSSFNKELLESELFGHLSGAFTNAVKNKKGLIEEANGGTLFLDEIGEMAFELQAKLLRVLETSEFIKVGDIKSTRVNLRIIAATNRNLQTEVDECRFREDLFYRLNIFTINLPTLRERRNDIPLLANHYLHLYDSKWKRQITGMNKEFLDQLICHEWRGNIRELKNIIERAVIMANGNELTFTNLPRDFQSSRQDRQTSPSFELSGIEKQHIERVLNHTKRNKKAAARLLNIGLTTLYRKIQEYKIS
jgi:two-component system NtrC family response regulator